MSTTKIGMRTILLAIAPIVGSASLDAANAATSIRPGARAECMRLAVAQNFGKRYIQRRNFIRDCMIDPEFNALDHL